MGVDVNVARGINVDERPVGGANEDAHAQAVFFGNVEKESGLA
jgi:hypothetical protein